MFTGLTERIGTITRLETPLPNESSFQKTHLALEIDAGADYQVGLGDSVAINGCCLTVTRFDNSILAFDLSGETLNKTSFSKRQVGDPVNMERALRLGDRLGGHIVQGHVDGTGQIQSIDKSTDGWQVKIQISSKLSRYAIKKGSICIDGVSLTVNNLEDDHKQAASLITLTLVPTTVQKTTFSTLATGQRVNIEVDCLGKYIERLQSFPTP